MNGFGPLAIRVLDQRMVGGLEQSILPCPERKGEQVVMLRCRACGRGALARIVSDADGQHPDGLVELQHLDGCPVLAQSKREAS